MPRFRKIQLQNLTCDSLTGFESKTVFSAKSGLSSTSIIAKLRQSVKLLFCYNDTFNFPQILRSSAICSLCGSFASSAETYPPMYARLFPAPNRRPYRSVIFLHSSVRRSFLPRRGKCRAYLHSENGVERGRGVPYSVEGVASRRSVLRGSLRMCGGERPEPNVRENQNCP